MFKIKSSFYTSVATLGLVLANITAGTTCFLGLYEPDLPDED
jgi:cyclic lactone autoinducer peptide